MIRSLLVGFLFFCSTLTVMAEDIPPPAKIKVEVSSASLYESVLSVGKERIEVGFLVPAGVDSVLFQPTQDDIQRINDAQIFIYQRDAADPWVARLLPGITNQNLLIIDVEKASSDKTIVDLIADALATVDPEGRSFYRSNAETDKAERNEQPVAIQDFDR